MICGILLSVLFPSIKIQDRSLGRKSRLVEQYSRPFLGWNSYDAYGYGVNEQEILDNAEFMHRHLQSLGWSYVVVDFLWWLPRLGPLDYPQQNQKFEPHGTIDAYGRYMPDKDRFPSSSDGNGFAQLASMIHSKGLKFGIHLMRGIPREAVARNLPISGSQFTCGQAGQLNNLCHWNNYMETLVMHGSDGNEDHSPGQAYLDSIFKMYAGWGVDFVKVDDLSSPYSAAEVEGYRRAINKCGRSMVLSLSPGETPISMGFHVSKNANMWRLLNDFWDDWSALNHAFDVIAKWAPYRSDGHYPDPDMLALGHLRIYGPNTGPPDSHTRFSDEEAKTVVSLWAISGSPLIFGGDLPTSDKYTVSLLSNPQIINMDQNSVLNLCTKNGNVTTWLATDKSNSFHYYGLFNRTDSIVRLKIKENFPNLQISKVHNLWTDSDQAVDDFITIPSHGCAIFKD